MRKKAELVLNPGTDDETIYPFENEATVGRRRGRVSEGSCRVVIRSVSISGRHCVVRQEHDGRFFIRDLSRNGTRVASRRLVPTVPTEIQPGQRILLPDGYVLELRVGSELAKSDMEAEGEKKTEALVQPGVEASVLIGDIASYTTISQNVPAPRVVSSVQRVMSVAAKVVDEHQGTTWKYEGDAILAFWESDEEDPGWHCRQACSAALALDPVIRELSADPDVWQIPEYPLRMDFAVTTGKVVIATLGGGQATGLAVYGFAVNHAKRLEKIADDATGPIVIDQPTFNSISRTFSTELLGEYQIKGRPKPEPVYALQTTR